MSKIADPFRWILQSIYDYTDARHRGSIYDREHAEEDLELFFNAAVDERVSKMRVTRCECTGPNEVTLLDEGDLRVSFAPNYNAVKRNAPDPDCKACVGSGYVLRTKEE